MCVCGLSAIFAVAVSSPAAEESAETWVAWILRELGRTQASGFIFDVVKGTLLGALFGIVLAVVACMLFSRLGWYDLKIRLGGALRWTVYSLVTVLTAILLAFAGLWSGAVKGSERVLAGSQLATGVFPEISDTVADAMAWVQVHASSPESTSEAEISKKLDDFRAGKWELHAARFLEQLDQLKNNTITNAIAKLEQSTLERTPQLRGGLGEKLLRRFVSGLGHLLVERKAVGELKGWGADQIYLALREGLKAEAAKSGDPETIKHGDISQFIIREGIVPGMMKPIRSTARAQQLTLVALASGVIFLPPFCLKLARSRFGRARKPEASPTDAPPAFH